MNNTKNDWDPNKYLHFEKERTQPSIDLISRINYEKPNKIIDIGCGPGNSTAVLKTRWPKSKIIGIDSSESMILVAKEKYPEGNWMVRDASVLGDEKYDIVFSNAVIQWIPNHEKLFKNLLKATEADGCIAIQVPLYHQMPVYSIVQDVFVSLFTSNNFCIKNVFNFNDSEYYYDLLADSVKTLDIWETNYIHSMDSIDGIYKMIETTGVKPYLDSIDNNNDKHIFSEKIKENLQNEYKTQKNGKVLFPFKRLFIVAKK